MNELRSAPRAAARMSGRVAIPGRPEIAVTIRDLSALGARLGFNHPIILPRVFRLLFDSEDHKVTVMWQAGVLAGVRFHNPVRTVVAPKKKKWPWSRG